MPGAEGHIFISYAREDEAIASKLADILTAIGYNVWIDQKRLRPGFQWEPAIGKAIDRAYGALFLASGHSLSKESYVREELALLLERQKTVSADAAFLIPVRLDDSIHDAESLKHLNWIDFRPPIAEKVGPLVAGLQAIRYKLEETSARTGRIVSERVPKPENTARVSNLPDAHVKGTSGRLFLPEELDIYCNKKTKETFIFHGKEIDKGIRRLVYYPDGHYVVCEMDDGRRLDLGVKIQWLIEPHFRKADVIQIVRTKDGTAIDGFSVPLVIVETPWRVFRDWLWTKAALLRGELRRPPKK